MRYTKSLKYVSLVKFNYFSDPDLEDSHNHLYFWKAIKRNRLEVLNINVIDDFGYFIDSESKLANLVTTIEELSRNLFFSK